jgi:hypothetical protein
VFYLGCWLHLDREYGRSPREVLQRHVTLAGHRGRTVLDKAAGACGRVAHFYSFFCCFCSSSNALFSVILRRYNLRSNIHSNLRKYNYSMFCILASISVATGRLSIDGTRHLSTLIYGHPAAQVPSISVVLRARASGRFSLGLSREV